MGQVKLRDLIIFYYYYYYYYYYQIKQKIYISHLLPKLINKIYINKLTNISTQFFFFFWRMKTTILLKKKSARSAKSTS